LAIGKLIVSASIAERAMKAGKVATADLPQAIAKLYRETLAALQKGQAVSDKGIRDLYEERAQTAKK